MNEENNLQPQDAATLPNAPDLLRQDGWFGTDLSGYWLQDDDKYEQPVWTLSWCGIPFAPLGNIHALTGQSGHGKTMTFSQIIAAILGGQFGNLRCILPEDVKRTVLYIDTEMSKNDTLRVRERIFRLLGWRWGDHHPELRILRLRDVQPPEVAQQPTPNGQTPQRAEKAAKTGLPLQEARIAVLRWKMVLQAIWEIRPTVAVIDGMLDVIRDYNDIEECQEIITKCMQVSSFYNCSVWCLVHQNPGRNDKMAGSLGSILERKVDLGFVASMADQGSFKDLLKAILEEDGDLELEEAEGGVQYVNMHGTALIFSSDWVYAGQASDIEETVAELQKRASSSQNFANTPAFAKLEKKDGLAQMLFLGAGIEAMNTREVKEAKKAINKMLPDGAELKDIASLTDFTLGDGELLISAETVPLSDAWQEYIDKTDKTALDFTKEQCKYVSGEALSVFANFDIKTYYKLLKPVLKEQMGAGSDELEIIDQLVKSLDGTVAFDLYGLNDESEPQFSLYVGTKNDEPINFVLENMADSVVNNGDGEYLIPINEYDWFSETYEFKGFQGVGYRNGMTYYVTDPETAFSAAGEKFPTKELKGKGFYARFNFGFLNKLASEMRGEEADIAEKVADTYDAAEMYYEGNGKAVFRITTKSKKTNPIQALIKLVEDYL